MKSLRQKCVLVLDRVTYHTMLTPHTKRMRISYNKPVLIDAIKRWGGPPSDWSDDWEKKKTKTLSFERCAELQPDPKYQAQELVDTFADEQFHCNVIFLPVAHPELNPIEHVWGIVKNTVESENFDFSLRR